MNKKNDVIFQAVDLLVSQGVLRNPKYNAEDAMLELSKYANNSNISIEAVAKAVLDSNAKNKNNVLSFKAKKDDKDARKRNPIELELPDFLANIQRKKEADRQRDSWIREKEVNEMYQNSHQAPKRKIVAKKKGTNTKQKLLAALVTIGILFGSGMILGMHLESKTHGWQRFRLERDLPDVNNWSISSDGIYMNPSDQEAYEIYMESVENYIEQFTQGEKKVDQVRDEQNEKLRGGR